MEENSALLILGIILSVLALLCAILQIIQLANDKIWLENSRRKLSEGGYSGLDVESIMKRQKMSDFMMCCDTPTQIIFTDNSGSTFIIRCVFSKIAGKETNQIIEIQSDQASVGREKQSQIQINDMNISRRHAVIIWRNNKLWINDCGSQNGTYVNGERISKETELSEGSLIKVGNSEFNVEIFADR